jgi:hypothetical protein
MGFFALIAFCIAVLAVSVAYEQWLKHRERMKVLSFGENAAKAMLAAPRDKRSALARELLEAYDEAGQGLEND